MTWTDVWASIIFGCALGVALLNLAGFGRDMEGNSQRRQGR